MSSGNGAGGDGDGAGGNGVAPDAATTCRVVVVGVDQASCESLGRVLVAEGCASAFTTVPAPESTLESIQQTKADLVLINEAIGRGCALGRVREAAEGGSKVVTFGGATAPGLVLEMVEAGAVAVIDRAAPIDEIVATVRLVRAGRSSFPAGVVFRMARRPAPGSRSPAAGAPHPTRARGPRAGGGWSLEPRGGRPALRVGRNGQEPHAPRSPEAGGT